jgi:hypothetical protein
MAIRRISYTLALALLLALPASALAAEIKAPPAHSAWSLWDELLGRGRALMALIGGVGKGDHPAAAQSAPAPAATPANSSGSGGSGAQGDSGGAMDPDGGV